MDVNMISSLSQQTATVKASLTKSTTTDEATKETTTTEAFSLEISAKSEKASAALGKLTTEQVNALKEGIDKSYQLMIKVMTEQNTMLQGYLDKGLFAFDFEGINIGLDKFALPPVGTTPEEAAAAIDEGGDYSVDAVATRIMDMVTSIAGDDPEKLKMMQEAVEEGFKQAGQVWKETIGEDEMPQITKDTHDEITKRFNELFEKLGINVKPVTEEAE